MQDSSTKDGKEETVEIPYTTHVVVEYYLKVDSD